MTAQEFAYWLQGFAELNAAPPTDPQWQSIREHLSLVFDKVTPPVAAPSQQLPWFNTPQYHPNQIGNPTAAVAPRTTC